MASIHGLQLKAVNLFEDHEGCPAYQGNIYLSNRKIGTYSNDYMCGPDHIDLDFPYSLKLLEEELKRLHEDIVVLPIGTGMPYARAYTAEDLFLDILSLNGKERLFKKVTKDAGYCGILTIDCGMESSSYKLPKYLSTATEESIVNMFDGEIKKFETGYQYKYLETGECKVEVYRSLDDFKKGERIFLSSIVKKENK